jgi:phosphoglucosamine mutase
MKKTQNKKRFFGTDGIRGIANHDLTPELVLRLGRALVHVLQGKSNSKFLIGKDPRLSSDMLEGALVAGLISAGGTVVSCGILPTPAISYLTRSLKFTAGIMISASHNPVEHN